MNWSLFWTIIGQVALAATLLAVPIAFFVYMVGMQFYKIRPQVKIDTLQKSPVSWAHSDK